MFCNLLKRDIKNNKCYCKFLTYKNDSNNSPREFS